METLLLLLIIPIASPLLARAVFQKQINVTEMIAQMVIVSLLVSVAYGLGLFQSMSDTEVWNGMVVKKDRIEDSYLQPYQCNCRTVSCGKNCSTTVCDTCYEEHYTVAWKARTTVGNVTFKDLDSTSRSVYSTPDPIRYKQCVAGEPASIEHRYVNYVKAVPDSLFNTYMSSEVFQDKLPSYPRVYDFYRFNRVVNVGSRIPVKEQKALNDMLNTSLIKLGPQKQVNVIVILTEIDDSSYRNAVENAWVGGKKNDVVIFLGLDDHTITWTDAMTFALNKGNELFQVKTRDALRDLKTFDAGKVHDVVISEITKHYDRPLMRDFEYLKDAIEPPTWVIVLCLVFGIGGSAGLSYFFYHNEVEDVIGNIFFKLWRKLT